MTIKRYVAHVSLLFLELSVLLAVVLRSVFADGYWATLVHFNWLPTYALAVLGLSAIFIYFVARLGMLRLDVAAQRSFGAKMFVNGLAVLSVVCTLAAGRLTWVEYPEFFRSGKPLVGSERIASLGGVIVHFDADGGNCSDGSRILKHGASYSDNVNVYVLDDERNFDQLMNVRVNLPRNLFVASVANGTQGTSYAHYFSSDVIPLISKSEKWSYVVDVESMKGNVADWYVGQTWSTNNNVYSHIEGSRIGANDGKWKTRILQLGAGPWSHYTLLDRGVIFVGPGQTLDMSFRVSLFAGWGVSEQNYHYVKPGETLACPLPVPTRERYAFDGWYDGGRRITEESKVERRESHTLKARWRKL